jgi:mannobiose 2-epimerase
MNTHLHLLEAYTNLLRTWNDASVRSALKTLILVTLQHLVDRETGHFKLHFDAAWRSLSDHISYGHDIEGSWLLVEAAEVLDDADLWPQVKETAQKMAQATYEEGVTPMAACLMKAILPALSISTKTGGPRPRRWWVF